MNRTPAEERAGLRQAAHLRVVRNLSDELSRILHKLEDVLAEVEDIRKSLELPDAELIGGADDEPTTSILRRAQDDVREVLARERAGEKIDDETMGFRMKGA